MEVITIPHWHYYVHPSFPVCSPNCFLKHKSDRRCLPPWKVKVLTTQLGLNLCDSSPPGSSVHGIFQTIILEWIAIPISRGSSGPRDWTQISYIAGGFFTIWATWETLSTSLKASKGSPVSLERDRPLTLEDAYSNLYPAPLTCFSHSSHTGCSPLTILPSATGTLHTVWYMEYSATFSTKYAICFNLTQASLPHSWLHLESQ